ncbi:MAG TPA: ABC transporter permease [Syntrophales bacterium]|nr:ABC transporter permease [Syntrophales bacterium]HOM06621.1 ABC transporter permease [Syntrophales bacterium]HON99771.1 ABC transporter permease [Syntrophales bacterium]HPC01125.1 ABC transporter permease [Syntrophales bacterium]HPQ06282.1 ABC transporter permease [Syntrophales bacterium]
MTAPGWYPVFLREMLHFRRKFFKLGYLFSAMVAPLIYLAAFGFGLGRSVHIDRGDYLAFLLPGLVAMSSMYNSYNWIASSLNINRLYFRTFQIYVQAPVSPASVMVGEVLAGMAKGFFASLLVIAVGFFSSPDFALGAPFVVALLMNCLLFSGLGVIVGMGTKSHEETATYSNLFIMPMAFFSGTFFPLEKLPMAVKAVIYVLPLTHTGILIRKQAFDGEGLWSLGVLVLYSLVFLLWGSRMIARYSE